MDDEFDFIRPALYGKLLRIRSESKSHYVHIDYCDTKKRGRWFQLTTCAEYAKCWVGYDRRDTRSGNVRVGNSVLIKLRPGVYMYAGLDVYTLRIDDEITGYRALEGGGRTPFSVGFGLNTMYFLTEHMTITYDEMLRYLGELPIRQTGDLEIDEEWLRELGPTALYRHAYAMQSDEKCHVSQMNIIGKML
jgi:hypothetical protein